MIKKKKEGIRMGKQILVISSSPRANSNSESLSEEFLRGAMEKGHCATVIRLKDKKIMPCTGCGYCFQHKGSCTQKDDMQQLQEEMIKADVIVLSSPVYFYSMNGQMKTFIDRNCFFYESLTGKEVYYIMTAADGRKESLNPAIEGFRGYLSCLPHAKECGIVRGVGAWETGEIQGTDAMKLAYELGREV